MTFAASNVQKTLTGHSARKRPGPDKKLKPCPSELRITVIMRNRRR